MKEILLWILFGISILFLFGCFVYFVKSHQENEFNELKTEIVIIIENSDLTEYQEEKLLHYLNVYKVDDFSDGEIGKVYYLTGFKRFVFFRDYDFWQEIKGVFNEN